MNRPLFSIIIPIYNAGQYLTKCLNSIKSQTYQDYEVLMVNDGSSDNSKSIIEEFSQTDIRFITINQTNGGASSARNSGIERAKGKYLMFIDSDDYWNNNALLSDLRERIVRHHEDVILIGCQNLQLDGKAEVTRGNYKLDIIDRHNKFETLRYLESSGNMPGSAWIMCVDKGLIDVMSLRFPMNVSGEDFYWVVNILHHCKTIGAINNIAYCYVKHPGSVTSTSNVKGVLGVCCCVQNWLKQSDMNKYESITRFLAQVYIITLMSYSRLSPQSRNDIKVEVAQSSQILRLAHKWYYSWTYQLLGPRLTGKIAEIAYKIIR